MKTRFALLVLLLALVTGCKSATLPTLKRADELAARWQDDLEKGRARYNTDDALNDRAHNSRLGYVKKARENYATAIAIEEGK